jgi:hypothetical protein
VSAPALRPDEKVVEKDSAVMKLSQAKQCTSFRQSSRHAFEAQSCVVHMAYFLREIGGEVG